MEPQLIDLSLHTVLTKKGRSLIVAQLFGVWFVCIHLILFELCVREKKKKKK